MPIYGHWIKVEKDNLVLSCRTFASCIRSIFLVEINSNTDSKIAISFSGLPRRSVRNYLRFKIFTLGLRHVDVFIHSWMDPEDRSYYSHNPARGNEKSPIFQKAIIRLLYRPRLFKVQGIESWDLGNNLLNDKSVERHHPHGAKYIYGMESFKAHLLSSNISMWKSIEESFLLVENYSNEKNEPYDFVIRMRFDVLPTIKLKEILSDLRRNEVLIPETGHPKGMLNDWFAIGTYQNMKLYSNLFNEILDVFKLVVKEHESWCNEYGLSTHLSKSKVKVKTKDLRMRF
jgi:hypothetical protein